MRQLKNEIVVKPCQTINSLKLGYKSKEKTFFNTIIAKKILFFYN